MKGERNKMGMVKMWLFIIGICILHSFGITVFAGYLLFVSFCYIVLTKTSISVEELGFVICMLLSMCSWYLHYLDHGW